MICVLNRKGCTDFFSLLAKVQIALWLRNIRYQIQMFILYNWTRVGKETINFQKESLCQTES